MRATALLWFALLACAQQGTVPIPSGTLGSDMTGLVNGNVAKVGLASIGYGFAASNQAGTVFYFAVPFACSIKAWTLIVTSGTASVDVWKIAAGVALPTVSNAITGSEMPAVSANQAATASTLAGWTTAVAAGDILGFKLVAKSDALAAVTIQLGCMR